MRNASYSTGMVERHPANPLRHRGLRPEKSDCAVPYTDPRYIPGLRPGRYHGLAGMNAGSKAGMTKAEVIPKADMTQVEVIPKAGMTKAEVVTQAMDIPAQSRNLVIAGSDPQSLHRTRGAQPGSARTSTGTSRPVDADSKAGMIRGEAGMTRNSRMASFAARVMLLLCTLLPGALYAANGALGEIFAGHYAPDIVGENPVQAGGNEIFVKFFPDRWLGLMFVPYAYAERVDAELVTRALARARERTGGAAFIKDNFGLLEQKATVQIERYGYYRDRIVFECGAPAPCTIHIGNGFLEFSKPGVVGEHVVLYRHVDAE